MLKQYRFPGRRPQFPSPVRIAALLSLLAILLLPAPDPAPAACRSKALVKRPIVVIGEPLAAVCLRLNIAPLAWVGRKSLWEDGARLSAASEALGCPGRLSGPKGLAMIKRIRALDPKAVYMTHLKCRYRPDIDYRKIRKALRAEGIEPRIIAFDNDPMAAVQEFSVALDRAADGEKLAANYEKAFQRARARLAAVPKGLRVAVVSGTFQTATGKCFTRLEAAGGYSDAFVLKAAGAVNVAADIVQNSDKIDKGHLVLRRLDRVLAARPDVIAATGDALPVAVKVAGALRRSASQEAAPAVFALPLYVGADPLAYPDVLTRWAVALEAAAAVGDQK